MFERFTDRGRRVVILAEEEARSLCHNSVGTEHLLLAMAREGEGIAAQVLLELGFTASGLRDQIRKIVGEGQQMPTGHIPYSTGAKKVLELSLREALQLGHNFVGTEHLLLGFIRQADSSSDYGVAVLLGDAGEHDINSAELERIKVAIRQAVIKKQSGFTPTARTAAMGAGKYVSGKVSIEWDPETMRIEAPAGAIEDIIAVLSELRDGLGVLNQSVNLLKKFGFTVTPPPGVEQPESS